MLNKNKTLKKPVLKKIEKLISDNDVFIEDHFKKINANFKKADNIVVGDMIGWIEAEFTGSFRNAKFAGYSFHYGTITKDSYSAKGQHTFMIQFADGTTTRKKGRTLFKNICVLIEGADARSEKQIEKNKRGDEAKKEALENWLSIHGEDHPRYFDKKERLERLSQY